MLTRLDDPRVVTLAVAALLSAGLWIATWSTMGAMDMAAMGMSGAGMSEMDGGGMVENGAPAGGMAGMDMPMGGALDWSWGAIRDASAMWLLMMAAMMLPAMAPVLAIYAGAAAREDQGARLAARVSLFTLGYFLLWALFSVAAALLQLSLRDSAWFTMGGTLATPVAAGGLLLLAGAYQFTGIKHACLAHCRHPLQFLLAHWRPGIAGAFRVGAEHGLYCFGCCIAFMGLMFVFGAMNVWWMAAIAVFFLAEKIAPGAESWGRWVGGALIAAGVVRLATASA